MLTLFQNFCLFLFFEKKKLELIIEYFFKKKIDIVSNRHLLIHFKDVKES